MTKVKKSFRLPADVVIKIEESDNESFFVESAIRRYSGVKEEPKPLPKAEFVRIFN